jgi:plasmid maintenance system antidote protein VapI
VTPIPLTQATPQGRTRRPWTHQGDRRRRHGHPPTRLSEITTGKKRISTDTALRLENYLGIEADLWLRLQQSHELRLAKEAKKNEMKKVKAYQGQGTAQ